MQAPWRALPQNFGEGVFDRLLISCRDLLPGGIRVPRFAECNLDGIEHDLGIARQIRVRARVDLV